MATGSHGRHQDFCGVEAAWGQSKEHREKEQGKWQQGMFLVPQGIWGS